MSALSISQLSVATKEDFIRLLPAIALHTVERPEGGFEIRGSAGQLGLTGETLTALRRGMADVNAMLREPVGRDVLTAVASGRFRQADPSEAAILLTAVAHASAAGDPLPYEKTSVLELPVPLAAVLAALCGAVAFVTVHLMLFATALAIGAFLIAHFGIVFLSVLAFLVLGVILFFSSFAFSLLVLLTADAASKGKKSIAIGATVVVTGPEVVLLRLGGEEAGEDGCAPSGGAGFAC